MQFELVHVLLCNITCSRQYLNEEQVWGGLIVEVTQRLEEKLGWEERLRMMTWWRSAVLRLRLLLVPQNMEVALKFSW